MSRIALLVCLILALVLTACVQPTPTPDTTSAPTADSSGYPAVQPTNTASAAYPAVPATATPADIPAPSSRALPRPHGSAARPSVR